MKKGRRTLTPKLRFPEFRDKPGWETCSLIDLADPNGRWSFIGGPFGSNLKASDYTPEGVRIIQLQNIGDGEFLDEYKIYTSQAKADELLSCNAYPGEIILSKMGDPVGRACITPASESRYVMCSDGIRFVVDENRFDKMFVFLSINFGIFRQRVESAATGSTRKRIGLDTLRQLPLEIPDRTEQQKIAECLNSLDGLITADGRKLEALKAHKKGLMQQLFPQPGENQPRLRFRAFRDKGEWEEKRLEKLAKRGSGHTPSKSKPEYYNGGIKWVSLADSKRLDNGLISDTEFEISDQGIKNSSAILHPAGTVLISRDAGVGKSAIMAVQMAVTFFYLPQGQTQQSFASAHPDLFNHADTKARFHVDAYFVPLDDNPPEHLVERSAYWYSLWSHRRNGQWKGYLQIDLSATDDAMARAEDQKAAEEGAIQ